MKKTSLNKKICLSLLNQLTKRKARKVTIVSSKSYSIAVDEKNAKLASLVLNYYNNLENYEKQKTPLFKKAICLSALSLYLFLKSSNYEEEKLDILTETDLDYEEIINESQRIVEDIVANANKSVYEEKEEYVEKQISIYEEYNYYLTEHAKFYNFDSEKVIRLARTTTNNYKDFDKIIDVNEYNLIDPEANAIVFVSLLNQNKLLIPLEELGYSKEDFVLNDEVFTIPYETIDKLVLRNGYCWNEYLYKVAKIYKIRDEKMLLSVSFAEMGEDGDSPAARNKNNYKGMTNNDYEVITYQSPEAGVEMMCANFKNKYNDYTLENMQKFSGFHVYGDSKKKDSRTEKWGENVTFFYHKISENYEDYFPVNQEENSYMLARARTKY